MKGLTHKRVFRFFRGRLLFVAGAILVAAVAVSVGWSGYWYQFDGDELFYVNVDYVMAKGLVPYRDFFMSHPPFHFLLPTVTILTAGTNLTLLDALSSTLGLC